MSTERTNAAVMNISMKTPWARFVPSRKTVLGAIVRSLTHHRLDESTHLTDSGAEVNERKMAAPAIAPSNWATQYSTKRTGANAPTNRSASEMFGLKRPPVTRKKSHADTRRLKPIDVAIYITCSVVEDCLPPPCSVSAVAA